MYLSDPCLIYLSALYSYIAFYFESDFPLNLGNQILVFFSFN